MIRSVGGQYRNLLALCAAGFLLAACASGTLPLSTDSEAGPDGRPTGNVDAKTGESSWKAAMPWSRVADPKRLIGLSREAVESQLGPAPFVRRDGPVQILRYAGETCFLDVFMYRDDQDFHVHHVDARPKGAEQVTVGACYNALLATRPPQSG